MKTILVAVLLGGCGGQMAAPVEESATTAVIQYSVNAPYQISGASPAGNDGFVYSVLPCAPLACDPWKLTFCYQSTCFTLSQPLSFLATGEAAPPIPANGNLNVSGSVPCSQWKTGGLANTNVINWYDTTPTHWHIGIDVVCIDNSIAISGDWQRI